MYRVDDQAAKGHFARDAFTIDPDAKTIVCPNGQLVQIRLNKDGSGTADFGEHALCPLRAQCTDSASSRTVRIHPKHKTLARSRTRQRHPVCGSSATAPPDPRSSARSVT